MLIKLRSSQLFNTDPARRFAAEYKVQDTLWLELWKRHKILDYSISEMAEFFKMKSGKDIALRQIKRWIFLSEIFTLTKPAREKGAQVVDTCLFGKLEQRVVNEIVRGMRFSSVKRPRSMV